MEEFTYTPTGVCSSKMTFKINNNIIENFEVIGGCNGNLKGIKALIKGLSIDEVIEKLDGIKCGIRNTSCPDQIANALKQYKEKRS